MALAPMYLGSLYTHLDECVAYMAVVGRYDVVSHMDSGFLQMFLLEHFGDLISKPLRYSARVPSETEGVVGATRAKNVYIARALWWVGMKQSTSKSLDKVIDKEENFNVR